MEKSVTIVLLERNKSDSTNSQVDKTFKTQTGDRKVSLSSSWLNTGS